MTDTVPRHVGTTSDAEEAAYLELALADEHSVQSMPAATEEPLAPAARDTVLVLDFGSQYTRLIARRIRECRVYCELLPPSTPWPQILARRPLGIVLSGGPASVYDPGAPRHRPSRGTAVSPCRASATGWAFWRRGSGARWPPGRSGGCAPAP